MGLEEVRSLLARNGFKVLKEVRNGNGSGNQLRLESGQIVNVYDTGKVDVQGKNPERIRLVLGTATGGALAAPVTATTGVSNKVFVVYGHDKIARTELEAMLLRWGLEPLILDQLPSGGQTIIEKLEAYIDQAGFGVVLATPDDEGHRAGHGDKKAHRARQNVVLELGMLLTRLGRDRVAILLRDQVQMERPSDIQGLIYIPYKDSLQKEAGLVLAKEMLAKGYAIDLKNV